MDTFLDRQISKEMYDTKLLEIQNEKTLITKQINEMEEKHVRQISTLEPTKEVFLRACRAKKTFLKANDEEKREMVENIVWNLSFKNQTMAQYQFKSPYIPLLKIPKNADFSIMRKRRDSNPRGSFTRLHL